MKVKIKKWLLCFLSLCLLAGVIPFSAVSAVDYLGKGTKSNPYLVETAEQLMGISNNLSACYKLNNTIDLKDVAFEPIGNLAKPFTGSFTCDLDSDGTPKYAIKNVTLKGAEFSSLAKQNNAFKSDKTNEWEIGLFRSTNGATLSNIMITDASVTCGVIGESWQNLDYTFNKGIDQQGVAILVGIAQNTTITGCITTGKIKTTGSAVGLLAGTVKNSTVQNSYSIGEVSSSGKWCIGAFIGSIETSEVKNCFAEGSVEETSSMEPGAFGTVGKKATVENCYFAGTVNPACNFVNDENTCTINNCSMSAKDVGVKKITDFSKYVPKSGTDSTPAVTNSQTSSTGDGGDTASETSSTEQTNSITAEELIKKLTDAEASQVNGWDFDTAYEIIGFKDLYAAMSPEESDKISDAYLSLMTTLYDSAKVVVVSDLTDQIDKLPDADKITVKNASKVLETCEKFYALPEDIQSVFSDKRVDKVKACYEKAKELQDVRVVNQTVKASASVTEKLLIIVLMVINIALLAVAITLAILVFRNVKKQKRDMDSTSVE